MTGRSFGAWLRVALLVVFVRKNHQKCVLGPVCKCKRASRSLVRGCLQTLHHFFKTPRARGGFLVLERHSPQPGMDGRYRTWLYGARFFGWFSLFKSEIRREKVQNHRFCSVLLRKTGVRKVAMEAPGCGECPRRFKKGVGERWSTGRPLPTSF